MLGVTYNGNSLNIKTLYYKKCKKKQYFFVFCSICTVNDIPMRSYLYRSIEEFLLYQTVYQTFTANSIFDWNDKQTFLHIFTFFRYLAKACSYRAAIGKGAILPGKVDDVGQFLMLYTILRLKFWLGKIFIFIFFKILKKPAFQHRKNKQKCIFSYFSIISLIVHLLIDFLAIKMISTKSSIEWYHLIANRRYFCISWEEPHGITHLNEQ